MVIYGYHAIEEMLKNRGVRGVLLVARNNPRSRQLAKRVAGTQVRVEQVSPGDLDLLCKSDRHHGVALSVERPTADEKQDLRSLLAKLHQAENALIVCLDGITDPHNLGAILRSCDQFAVDLVITPEHKSARDSETVLRISAGASRHVRLCTVPNLVQALRLCRQHGFWIYGADLKGERSDETKLEGKVILVLGSEGKGLRRLVMESCDQLISIPAHGHIDSLNVSVAAGILLYEVRRQQGFRFLE
jgi:23S rRNA (guanosine2251-2'-O)-methyltransferase